MRSEPIIAVTDVEASANWYCTVLGCKDLHGGKAFAILVTADDEVLLCLHQWGAHEHPTMVDPSITPGNGSPLYFRTENISEIHETVKRLGFTIEEALHKNQNSNRMEFSLRDPDGYFITISDFHTYEG